MSASVMDHRLQHLDHHIAEVLEESLVDARAFGVARLGKDLFELPANYWCRCRTT